MQVSYPYRIDNSGRTESASDEKHIRDLIEQVLFTAPGERVNRPTFGCGLQLLIFMPNSDTLSATTEILVQDGLQEWLGTLIDVDEVDVQNDESLLTITIQYTIRRTQQQRIDQFFRGVS